MNAGKNHTKARAQAQANADRSQSPRWLHQYGGAWWISTTPVADAERISPGKAKARHHATKKSPAPYDVYGRGPLEGETTYYSGTDRRAAEAAFNERARRNYEGQGDDSEHVVIARDGRVLRRFGPDLHQPTYFGSPSKAASRHHATKKSPAQLQREIDEALSQRKPRRFATGDPNNDDYLRFLDDVNDPPRTDLIRAHKDDLIRAMDKPASKRHHVGGTRGVTRSHATKKPHILTEEGRLADLQLQGFMKRGPMRTWVVAVEDPSGDPSAATYVEVQGKTEAAALRAAQARKPGRKLTVRYAK